MADVAERHIFLLDDEPIVCEVIKETLEGPEIKVSSFTSPAECLVKLRSQRCDLLITDLKMPEMNGIELLTKVKHLTPWVPVLLITGYGDIPKAVEAMKAGAVDFIEKPLIKEDFVRKVESILQQNTSTDPDVGKLLTRTEIKILKLVVEGNGNKEISNLLHRSKRTVEVHRAHIMHKLGADNLVDLVKRVAEMGLVDLETKQEQEGTAGNKQNDL